MACSFIHVVLSHPDYIRNPLTFRRISRTGSRSASERALETARTQRPAWPGRPVSFSKAVRPRGIRFCLHHGEDRLAISAVGISRVDPDTHPAAAWRHPHR